MKLIILLILTINLIAEKPKLFLLNTYKEDMNITGWYMSEKLDGVRAYWDGEKLISRGGNTFYAPAFFIKGFPKHKLDGELWSKRGEFDRISSIVRTKIPNQVGNDGVGVENDGVSSSSSLTRGSRWNELTYNIFEVPEAKGDLLQRLSKVKETKYLKLIKQIKIKNKKHLKSFHKEIQNKKGEGVVVRDGSLPYYTGRDKNALKVKSFLDDECIVVEHLEGNGKYENILGSIKCKLKSGRIIKVGSGFSDIQRKSPPKVGSVITFKYYGLTSKGNPRFPVFLRVRK